MHNLEHFLCPFEPGFILYEYTFAFNFMTEDGSKYLWVVRAATAPSPSVKAPQGSYRIIPYVHNALVRVKTTYST